MVPKVDTFEHDIADEIKRKEASLAEISAASNDIGNHDVDPPKKPPIFIIAVGTFLVLCLLGFGALGYFYFNDSLLPPSSGSVPIKPSDVPKTTTDLQKISPTLANEIGRFVTRVEKKEQGYILTITDYTSVFAYMIKNESAYRDELAPLFADGKAPLVTSSTTNTQAPQTQTISTTTFRVATSSTSTTTPKVTSTSTLIASSSAQAPTPVPDAVKPFIAAPGFTDITIANQNMRVWTNGNKTVVYAFVGNTTLLISNGTEGILTLKSAILH
jgi:hypothetical protein